MLRDDLGNRMKDYEYASRFYLEERMPIIIRVDGKAFHSFTKGFVRPFDDVLIKSMQDTARYLCENIMGCKLAYTQSDEISLLLVDYENENTQAWFGGNIQKMASVAASMATMAFNQSLYDNLPSDDGGAYYIALEKGAMFDARVFTLSKNEVCNYFIWRQQDAIRNSIQMAAQSMFSHRELQNKSCSDLKEMMISDMNIDWNDYALHYQRGSCCIKEQYMTVTEYSPDPVERSRWVINLSIPLFTEDRDFIDGRVYVPVSQ